MHQPDERGRGGWTQDYEGHWYKNAQVTADSIYEIGGVGLPPFEMFAHCLPDGAAIRQDNEEESRNEGPAIDAHSAPAHYWARPERDIVDDEGAIEDDAWVRYGSRMRGRPNSTAVQTVNPNTTMPGAEYDVRNEYLVNEMAREVTALLLQFRTESTANIAARQGMPTWLYEGYESCYRVWIGDLPETSTLASFVRQWIS
eukprot:3531689-Heterocapsa_arctica.AAC.1